MNRIIDKLLYLGPRGSYSESIIEQFSEYFADNCNYEPIDSIYNIIKALNTSESATIAAIIPIENSVEGIVRESQDNLTKIITKGFRINAERVLNIEHCLIGYCKKEEIQSIKSHPQALAQCREFINDLNKEILLEPALSTSSAVKSINKENPNIVAIGSESCAKLYNIPIIETFINDEKNNTTRFILLTKNKPIKTKNNKVSIVFSTENKSGALNKILSIIERYELNMTYIDSRPSRKELGDYIFYIDFIGHTDDSNVYNALVEIQTHVKFFEILSEGANF